MDWVRELSAADRALSELAGVGRTPPNPHLLIRPFARKEAVLSSRIEGTQASLSDLLFFEAASTREKAGSDVREVANYVTALEHGLARLVESPVCLRLVLLLCHEKLMPQPLLYLSAYFERNRDEYYRRLLDVSMAGAWEAWNSFFLRGVAEQAADAVRRSDRLLAYWTECRERLHAERAGSLALRLVDDLFDWPALSVMQVASRFEATPAGIQRCVERLARAGILRETTGGKRNRVYMADRIVGILEEP